MLGFTQPLNGVRTDLYLSHLEFLLPSGYNITSMTLTPPRRPPSQEAGPLVDTLSDTTIQPVVAYANVGAEVATDKLVLRETQVARMGTSVDGVWGRVSAAMSMI